MWRAVTRTAELYLALGAPPAQIIDEAACYRIAPLRGCNVRLTGAMATLVVDSQFTRPDGTIRVELDRYG